MSKNWNLTRKNKNAIFAMAMGGIVLFNPTSYVVARQIDYSNTIKQNDNYLNQENQKFISLVQILDAKKVNLTSVGNSIAAGYSMKDKIMPLLRRNEELFKLLKENNIEYTLYDFSRPQDNTDNETLKNLFENIAQSEMNERIQYDYRGKGNGVKSSTISDQQIQEYYPLTLSSDKGLSDVVETYKSNEMNIIIYNGGTGSFLDSVNRGSEDLFESFDKDVKAVDAFCKYTLINQPNTQIYLCGIPNILDLNITNFVNNKYKDLAKCYPNVTYVDPAPIKLVYKTNDGLKIDIHPNEDEYSILNKNIMTAINDNYISNMIAIDLHVKLTELSDNIQFKNRDLRYNSEVVENAIGQIIFKYQQLDVSNQQISAGLEMFMELYKKNVGHDYYYTTKKITLEIFESYISDLNNSMMVNR